MALGDDYREDIVTADGRTLTVSPLAVEPVCDLAVLGAPDDQAFPEAAEAFETFCGATAPVRLALDALDLDAAFAAYVFTHDKGVLSVCATQPALNAATLWIEADEPIEGGTSGSPVVTSDGRLLGIVSNVGSVAGERQCTGMVTRVHLAAPAWLVRQMVPQAAQRKLNAALPPGSRRKLMARLKGRR